MKKIIYASLLIFFNYCAFGQETINLNTDNSKNHIIKKVLKSPYRNTPATLNTDDLKISVEYYDDFGKPLQIISVKESPFFGDILKGTSYDFWQRKSKDYLEYELSGNNGNYDTNIESNSDQFYYDYTQQQDEDPWVDYYYENNPLNKNFKTVGPGLFWKNNETPEKPSYQYIAPTVEFEEFIEWSIDNQDHPYITGYNTQGNYIKEEKIDESGHAFYTFYNTRGLKVLERRQAASDQSLWHDTYYIYDDFDQLRYVLPPQVFANDIGSLPPGSFDDDAVYYDQDVEVDDGRHPSFYIEQGHSARLVDGFRSDNQQEEWFVKVGNPKYDIEIFDDLVFQYNYDKEGNLIEKKVPGADWVFYVYDQWNRMVLTQDGNMRENNEWLFYKYDANNRVIIEGVTIDSRSVQDIRQAYADHGMRFEILTQNNNPHEGYTNNCPPQSFQELLKISYYDNYSFLSTWGDAGQYAFNDPNVGDPLNPITLINGEVTGQKSKILGSNDWTKSVTYFDEEQRPLQVVKSNILGGVDRETSYLDFTGKVVYSLGEHSSPTENITIAQRYEYDHADRLTHLFHSINGQGEVLVMQNEYDELGRLKDKKLHSTDGNTFMQSMDHQYNIRGWLTKINNSDLSEVEDNADTDYFGMEMAYQNSFAGVSDNVYADGNINAIKWSTELTATTDISQAAYSFNYDPIDRLTNANFKSKNTAWINSGSNSLNNVSYDLNGNILNLERTKSGTGIDNLNYTYSGNQLLTVEDTGTSDGFSNGHVGNSNIPDYNYDPNGNMVIDRNKGISNIEYNYLNLPATVSKASGEQLEFTYDALGVKLAQRASDQSGTLISQKHYVGNFIYEDNELSEIHFSDGRIIRNSLDNNWEYQYFIKDHLGNNRITFTSRPKQLNFRLNYESSAVDADDEDLFTDLVNIIQADIHDYPNNQELFNHDHVQVLTGAPGSVVGSVLTLPVGEGDRVDATVFAKYTSGTGATNPIPAVGSLIVNAITGNTGNLSYESAISNTYGTSGSMITNLYGEDISTTEPMAFINVLFLPEDITKPLDIAYNQIQPASNNNQAELSLAEPFLVPDNGYIVVYLSNEDEQLTEVFFDDLSVTVNEHPVIQRSDYYPYGLTFNNWQREITALPNIHKTFQDQELISDIDLNWIQFKWRNHDPTIGRFFNVDPLSDKYEIWSPYTFSGNMLIKDVELEGLEPAGYQMAMKLAQFAATTIAPAQKSANESLIRALTGNSANYSENLSENTSNQEQKTIEVMATANDINNTAEKGTEVAVETGYFVAINAAESTKHLGEAVTIAGIATGQPELAVLGDRIAVSGEMAEFIINAVKTGDINVAEAVFFLASNSVSSGLIKFGDDAVSKGDLAKEANQIWQALIEAHKKGAEEVYKEIEENEQN